MKKAKAALLSLTIVSSALAAEWKVNTNIRRDPSAPAIQRPTLIELKLTDATKARTSGLGDRTVAEVYVGYRVKCNVNMLRSTRCDYSILLQEKSGRIYKRKGFAYQTMDTVTNLNRQRESVIQAFKVKPNTKIVGYRFGLYNANVLHDEIAWTAADILARGYSETWYEN